MTLPATGGTWTAQLEPSLQPLAVRYWQISDVLIADYFDTNGNPNNWADPACGLGSDGLFTPFATDGSIRGDLLATGSATPNQGLYHLGELKEDTTAITPDQTVTETPTAQSLRTVRDVLTKLDDKIDFTPLEASDLVNRLRYELPLAGWSPADGQPGYQISRGVTDFLQERRVVILGVDGDGQLLAEVFPRVVTNKKGKTELQRKNPQSLALTYTALPDPMTGKTMWLCRSGVAWEALSGGPMFSGAPVATAVTGLKANIVFPTPTGGTVPYTYSVTQQAGGVGAFTAATLSSATGTVAGSTTTLVATGLTATTAYVFKVTVTDANSKTSTAAATATVTTTAS